MARPTKKSKISVEIRKSNYKPNLQERLKQNLQSFFINYNIKTTNKILSGILILISIYIAASPFFPQLTLKLSQASDKTNGYKYESSLAAEEIKKGNIKEGTLKPRPLENTLVLPDIGVDAQIFEGESAAVLDIGIWRRPNTSTPDQGSNTVLTAHRFAYTSGPNTFYHLDKVKKGQKIILFWDKKEYNYEVTEVKVVEATAFEIEEPTEESILTLYTCTPLWTASQRLVVVAKLINSENTTPAQS